MEKRWVAESFQADIKRESTVKEKESFYQHNGKILPGWRIVYRWWG
jgi:hypothetical protein